MKQLFYSLGLSIALLAGCKDKAEEEPRFEATGTYTITTAPVAGAVRMFTRAGEVSNAPLIRRFAERNYSGLLYSPGAVSPYLSGELAFAGNGQATLTTTASQMGSVVATTLVCDITSQTSKSLVLTSRLPTVAYTPTAPNACYSIVRDIKGVAPVYTCTALSPSTGYSGQCESKPVYVLNLRGTQPSLALLSYIFSAANAGQTCSLGYRNDFNTFNTALPGRLNAGDTLVVQESELPLVKK
ncbi:hypothetical protein MON38_16210 [Hymenobacter sp. DH14]|uniref:Lipoprotein n=1 Tax=Hymenobacter cyanobacteriorum TaxID=2926463 RepID=A0A9X1VHN1_9BACT|nr:hypothetical protein [Hymenobacter cyanobacteriorum]MCI1188967.1 hypothetical protein [Hymenobacter cyanobacteriorum]